MRKNFWKNQTGFTLIELLVVISIIGVLSSMVVVSVNDARTKARDARRLSDIRQMANLLAIQATEGQTVANLEGCNAVSAEKNVRSCTGPGQITQFINFADPSIADPDNNGTICTAGSNSVCQYSMTIGSTNVENAEIYVYLESSVAGLEAGLHYINPNGVFDSHKK